MSATQITDAAPGSASTILTVTIASVAQEPHWGQICTPATVGSS